MACCPAPPDPKRGPTLAAGQVLAANQYLQSKDGHYRLVMQEDGNLVEYVGSRPLWSSETVGHPGAWLVMQPDGNLVVYGNAHQPLWHSKTFGSPGARLELQTDGNLVVYGTSGGSLWSNQTVNPHLVSGEALAAGQYLQSSDRHYRLVMQSDGNLVEYVGGRPLWSSMTMGNPGARAVMQEDGNLVVYSTNGQALWHSGTAGTKSARLALQPDANLVIYSSADAAVWANGAHQSTLEPGESLAPGQYLQASSRHQTLVMQSDGNLVLYGDEGARWSSNTHDHPGARLAMQADGNLVVYGPEGKALWNAATQGHAGARLAVQGDGNVVIYNSANQAVWASATSGSGGLPTETAAEKAAIAWARNFANTHDTSYNGACLKFVFDAYAAAGLNLRPWVNYPINGDTYPVEIWGRFTHGTTGQGTPPPGALVFWKSAGGDRTLSHVALSLGGGNLISTSDGVAPYTHYETLSQHAFAIYQGWWLPDQ